MSNNTKEISGIYSLEPNPCLTKPCLPGIIPAIKVEKALYFLVIDGHYVDDNFTWKGRTPEVGETITVKGKVSTKLDINNEKFLIIEIETPSKKD